MSNKVYCEDCVYCKPDRSFLTSFWGLDRKNAFSFAKCQHPNAARRESSDAEFVARTIALVKVTKAWCSVKNGVGDCADYTPKASVLEASFRMKLTRLLLLAIGMLLCACKSPVDTVRTVANIVQGKVGPPPLSVEDLLACARNSRTHDEVKEREKQKQREREERAKAKLPEEDRYVKDMVVGEYGYVWRVDSEHGKLYLNEYVQVTPKIVDNWKILVKREADGFLVNCDRVLIWNDDKSRDLIPIIGKLPAGSK